MEYEFKDFGSFLWASSFDKPVKRSLEKNENMLEIETTNVSDFERVPLFVVKHTGEAGVSSTHLQTLSPLIDMHLTYPRTATEGWGSKLVTKYTFSELSILEDELLRRYDTRYTISTPALKHLRQSQRRECN